MQDMLHGKGINWNDLPAYQKRGRAIAKAENGWIVDREIPVWTKEREWLQARFQRQWS